VETPEFLQGDTREGAPETGGARPAAEKRDPRPPRLSSAWLIAGAALMAVGVAGLLAVMVLEAREQASVPWAHGVVVVGEEAPWPEAERGFRMPVSGEDAPDSPLVAALRAQRGGEDVIAQFGLDDHGHVLALEASAEEWAALVGEGRAPRPGAFEALAGDLCDLDAVHVGEERFEVVGRARRGVGMLTRTYVIPMASFEAAAASGPIEAETVWFDRDAAESVAAMEGGQEDIGDLELHTYMPLTSRGLGLSAVGWLAVIVVGGVLAWTWIFRALGAALPSWAGAVFAEVGRAPRLYAFVHVLLYGAFLAGMWAAVERPELGFRLTHFVKGQFEDGGLSFIGNAYGSGSVLSAMATTWFWNYVMATVVMSIAPSFFLPFWGVAKNLLSFLVVGLALAPIWAGAAQGMTYHSGTMVLELQAYVLTAFFVSRYVVLVGQGLWLGSFGRRFGRAVAVMVTGTVAVGVMLGIAALYEAVTLILFHFV